MFKLRRALFSKQKVLICSPNEPFSLPSQERSAVPTGTSILPTNKWSTFLHGDVKDEVINISHFKAESIFIQHRKVNGQNSQQPALKNNKPTLQSYLNLALPTGHSHFYIQNFVSLAHFQINGY